MITFYFKLGRRRNLYKSQACNIIALKGRSSDEIDKIKMKKYLALGLCSLALIGCQKQDLKPTVEELTKVCQIQNKISYKLEDLCDTELYEKDITLYVYIAPSEILWDYHKYKEEIFGYVKDFFKEQNMNCEILFSESKLENFNSSNILGVEILDSEEKVAERYFHLISEPNDLIKGELRKIILNDMGYAATQKGIALISAWEEFRNDEEITKEEIEKQFSESYKGMTKKDYLFKENAGLICHELLHCVGLWHLDEFDSLVKEDEIIPNIMANKLPKFRERCSVGYSTTNLQKRLIHSFIEGNNTYKAFVDSQRDLELYLKNLAEANNLELNKKN